MQYASAAVHVYVNSHFCTSPKQGEMRVQRPASIRIKAQNVHGKTQRLKLEGFTARVFQHEYDHLEGTLFPDRMQLDHLERERKKLEKMEADFRKSDPRAEIESCLARLA